VTSGTITFSVSFKLKYSIGMFPGAPVHASAPQALRRPPPSTALWIERVRDRTLLLLGHKFFLYVAVIWALNIVGWGAFVALLYLGLFLLPPNSLGMDEDQTKYWINVCIQVLTALFSYQNGMTIPWRLAIGFHASGCGHGPWRLGTDFYGRPTDAIWFHIPRKPRLWITALLLAALVMHFSTQTCRVIWYSYYLSNDTLGTIPTNLTFFGSIVLAIAAGCIQDAQEKKLRAADKEAGTQRYPPTVEEALKEAIKRWRAGEVRASRPMEALKAAKASYQKETSRWFVSKEGSALQRTVGESAESSASTRERQHTVSRRLTRQITCGLKSLHLMSSSVSTSSAETELDSDSLPQAMGMGSAGARSHRSETCSVERGRSQTMGRGRTLTFASDRCESSTRDLAPGHTETATTRGRQQKLSRDNSALSGSL